MPITRIDRLINQLDRAIEQALAAEDRAMVEKLARQQTQLIERRTRPARVRKTLRPGTTKTASAAVSDLLRK